MIIITIEKLEFVPGGYSREEWVDSPPQSPQSWLVASGKVATSLSLITGEPHSGEQKQLN